MSISSPESDYRSSQSHFSNSSEFNKLNYVFSQLMNNVHTFTLVKILSVTNSGGLSEVGYVNVQPLVNMVDYKGNAISHSSVYNLPYFRLQGGSNAVIIDPEVGDIGLCAFADRDISKVKATKDKANPGSFRKYSMADGVYIGGVLNGVPSQYVQFNTSGITIHSPTAVNITAPTVAITATSSATITAPNTTVEGTSSNTLAGAAIALDGPMTQGGGSYGGDASFNGSITATGDVVGSGTSLHTHTHSGVTTGSGDTGVPN